jgi:hypothetical protein
MPIDAVSQLKCRQLAARDLAMPSAVVPSSSGHLTNSGLKNQKSKNTIIVKLYENIKLIKFLTPILL